MQGCAQHYSKTQAQTDTHAYVFAIHEGLRSSIQSTLAIISQFAGKEMVNLRVVSSNHGEHGSRNLAAAPSDMFQMTSLRQMAAS